MEKICGFAVVKRAKSNFIDDHDIPPQAYGVYYHGTDRLRWIDRYAQPYSEFDGVLPTHYAKILQSLCNYNGIEITSELEHAQDVLRFVNEFEGEQSSEIIVIFSKEIEETCGSFVVDFDIHWIGEDIVYGGSMLFEGIFIHPRLFSDFAKHLNQYGLFDINSPVVPSYIDHYNRLIEQGHSMEIFLRDPKEIFNPDRVWIGIPDI